jgi:hypothetical protein
MVAPVPAQIANLPTGLPAAARRRFPLRSRHSDVPSTSRTPARNLPTFRHSEALSSPLYFHHFANPSSRNRFIFTSMQNPRGCTLQRSRRQTFRRSNLSTLLFASAWRLFVASPYSFLPSFPLFSIVCSLISQNTRGGGASARPRVPVSLCALCASVANPTLIVDESQADLTSVRRHFMLWPRF